MKNNISTASTKLVAESYSKQYVQLENKSVNAMLDLMSDDIEWNIPGDQNLAPWVGKRQGKEEMKAFFELQHQYFIPLDVKINKTLIDEEHAILIGFMSVRILKTGEIFKSHFIAHLIVENSKITKYLFLEDSQALMDAMTHNSQNIDLIKQYFVMTDDRSKGIELLFSEDAELFYPKLGVVKGRAGVLEFARGFSDLVSLNHEIEDFTYHATGDVTTVEGTESGVLKNGKSFSKSRFCSIFTIKDNLIVKLHIYVDPDFGGEDTDRFRWGNNNN